MNPGGPGRGRRPRLRPWLAAGWRAGGVGRGSGLGIPAPCSPTAVGAASRVQSSTAGARGSVAPDPDPVSITLTRAFAHPPAPTPPSAAGPDHDPVPRLHGDVALNVQRHRGPDEPQHRSRPDNLAGSGRPAQLGSACSPEPPGSRHGGSASVRSPVDHRPFTRSAARSSIDHPPLGSAAEAERRDTKEATPRPRRAAAPSPGSEGRRLCHAEPPPRSAASRTCEPGENHPAPDLAAAPSRPDTYPAAGRSDPRVKVAAPAGPTPPPATCGRPEARPASA